MFRVCLGALLILVTCSSASEWEIALIDSGVWTVGLHLVALFREAMDLRGCVACRVEVSHWGGLWEFIAPHHFQFGFSAYICVCTISQLPVSGVCHHVSALLWTLWNCKLKCSPFFLGLPSVWSEAGVDSWFAVGLSFSFQYLCGPVSQLGYSSLHEIIIFSWVSIFGSYLAETIE